MDARRFHFGVALAALALATIAAAPQLPPQPKVHPQGIPADAMLVSPCVATMGYHWAALKNLPLGPIYGVMDGKPVFTEIMVDQKLFASGKSWDDQLKPLPGYHIDHVDIDFEPYGHPGYPIPHYDIHAYYVPHAIHMKFCPDGEKVRR
jgi:hypothetical protein